MAVYRLHFSQKESTMKSFLGFVLVWGVLGMASGVVGQDQVAITELLNNPTGLDASREYVELFNYGPSAIDLTGWTLEDEDGDRFTFGSTSIASGDFILVVNGDAFEMDQRLTASEAKLVFEEEWLDGVADARVIGIEGVNPSSGENFSIGNSGDELILKNDSGTIVWSLAYSNDDRNGVATYLTSTQLGTIPNTYGSKGAPGIDRTGDDNGTPGFLGYEHASSTVFTPIDPAGFESDPSDLVARFGPAGSVFVGPFESGNVSASFGSPLAGPYQVITTGVAGDYNNNGIVDAADYTVWRDGNSPDSSQAGYDFWKQRFGNTSGSSSGQGSQAIPEPTSLVLLIAGGLFVAVTQARWPRALR